MGGINPCDSSTYGVPALGDVALILLGMRRLPAAERAEVAEGRVVVVVCVPACMVVKCGAEYCGTRKKS